jgi:hypothetical protein
MNKIPTKIEYNETKELLAIPINATNDVNPSQKMEIVDKN